MGKWLVVGLGNPGKRYQETRHNAGFLVVDELAQAEKLEFKQADKFDGLVVESENYFLVKPQTFMNASGESVRKLSHFYKILPKNVIVIHDDLDVLLSQAKVSWAKGPHLHNGILSIEQELSTQQFWRVRVGVDNRNPEERRTIPGERYVLKPMEYEDKKLLKMGMEKAKAAIFDIMKGRYAVSG